VSQPTLRREGDARLTGVSSKKGIRAELPPTFIWGKMLEKPEKTWSTNFKWKVRELYLCTGKVLAPHAPLQRTAAFNQVCKYDFNLCYLPLFTFLCLFMPFYIFYLFVVDKGVSLAPTYSSIVIRKSNLCSSLRTQRWLNCFYPFFARYIFIEWKVF